MERKKTAHEEYSRQTATFKACYLYKSVMNPLVMGVLGTAGPINP